LASTLAIGGAIASGDCGFAQITPDSTLGSESSVVTPNVLIKGLSSDRIEGGARRGANLFHSFREFNIDQGRGGYFTNPAGIENILSRVTGRNPSDIQGTLGVLGNASLFLMNPNGVIFGPNARLDIRGSFIGTTANAVRLGDTGLFSASEPTTSNLLTVRPSALFFTALAAQGVVNQSQAQSLSGETNSLDGPVGLQVPTGQTLALVGGNVLLEGGNLTAAGGRIELGSIAGVEEVSLSQSGTQWSFGYDQVDAFRNIRLEGGALLDASGSRGGDVHIRAAQFEMTQGSYIFADTLGAGDGGELLVRTTEAITLMDGSRITADVLGSGTGGDLTITTGQLTVRDGAQISASTFGTGAGGNLNVTADAIEAIGVVSLPVVPVETEVVQACAPGGTGTESEFVVTGRGGLPTNPTQVLSRDAIEVDWVTLTPRGEDGSTPPPVSASPTATESATAVEAQGWVVNRDGEVVLTASADSAQPRSAGSPPADCRASKPGS